MREKLDQMTDEELMLAYKLGDEKAFEFIYKKYSGKVYGYLYSKLRNRELIDDTHQAAFLKLHNTRARYDSAFPFAPWLFTICRSVMIDTIRSQQRSKEDPSENVNNIGLPILENDSISIDLGQLPSHQKQILNLRYSQDLSFEEIAKHLETSKGNARQLVSRAIRKLRMLKKEGWK